MHGVEGEGSERGEGGDFFPADATGQTWLHPDQRPLLSLVHTWVGLLVYCLILRTIYGRGAVQGPGDAKGPGPRAALCPPGKTDMQMVPVRASAS